jgi:hypothetical protein
MQTGTPSSPMAMTPAMTGSAASPSNPSSAAPSGNSGAPAMPATTRPTNQPIPDMYMADAGDGWKTLITGHWEVPAGEETYQCVRFTVPEDLTISSVRALSPPGTHHTFLMVSDTPAAADGVSKCGAGTTGTRNIAGSGVGTMDFTMPAGVGIQLKKGQQLLLNLHLFNATEKTITGQSGTTVKVLAGSEVKQYAEGLLAGTINLNITSGGPVTQMGTCTMDHDVSIFAVVPHMHQLGIHLKAVAHSSVMGDVMLSDRPYNFESQLIYPMTPEIQMKKGDTISVECTYMNGTGNTVKFGESSLEEMCFLGTYRYPAGTGSFMCVR